ncbi:MAG: GTPase domain-containing protein [Clostridiales bacterium]|nr:GTPase domain-containing protein [Clostridiales bacterium]
MADTDLTKVLDECCTAAKGGYELALNEKNALDGILTSAENKIRETAIEYKTSPCEVTGMGEVLESQLAEIDGAVNDLRLTFTEDLETLKGDLEKFSITLFGRTMAGKSTLMEVLTEGDGSAIGMGAQRTTRDIRRYVWNGLAVTDVPGIGAFEGEEDTRLAFDAAKTADLIVFLLTDDAPQAVEAECFSQVKDLGKPVIVIMNVKVSIDAGKSRKLIERDMKRAFDYDRIEDIRKQFCKFADMYGQNWDSVPFVSVHLKSAYEAVKCEKSGDPDADFWREVSHIDELKSFICDEVRVRGKYIRVKTFADIIANPMIEALSELNGQSRMNEAQAKVISDKKNALAKRRDVFVKSSKKRIESFMMRLKTEFRMDIATFSEDHYNDKMADIAWGELVKNKKLEDRCRELLDDMETEVDSIIQEMLREMTSELKYVSVESLERNFLTPELVDAKRIASWTSLVLGSGGAIAAYILSAVGVSAAGPVGWIASAIGITGGISVLFIESRIDKMAKARANLEKELSNSVNSTCDNIWLQLEKNLDRLVDGKIDLVLRELTEIEKVINSLASTQDVLADSLRLELQSLNKTFTGKIASAVFGEEAAEGYMNSIDTVSRIPGVCTMLALNEEGNVGDEFKDKLTELLSEEIRFVSASEETSAFVSDVLGGLVSKDNIVCENDSDTVIIKTDGKDIRLFHKLRLLEQLVPYRLGG